MERANVYVEKALDTLQIRNLTPDIEIVGGHTFRVNRERQQLELFAEVVRVTNEDGSSMAFRLITSNGLEDLLAREKSPNIVLDNRPNLDGELPSGLFPEQFLIDAYFQIGKQNQNGELDDKVDGLLTPIREGSLGPTEKIGNYGPFTNETARYQEPWDASEEAFLASIFLKAIESGDSQFFDELKDKIIQMYSKFALPLVDYFEGELNVLYRSLNTSWFHDLNIDVNFADLDPKEFKTNLGNGEVQVDQLVAYPYPTEKGTLYIRLFEVWDDTRQGFEMVRVVQTLPKKSQDAYSHVEGGLRLDSGCHDGMHSHDAHCDCDAQLKAAIYGSSENENKEEAIVVQLMDHEGKGWGTVWKGATHMIMRDYNKDQKLSSSKPKKIGNPQASGALYDSLGEPHDKRDYRAAIAVMKVLGISHVDKLLMGNEDKILAIHSAGINYDKVSPVELPINKKFLTGEALRTLREKEEGLVRSTDGHQVIYFGANK